MLNAFQERILKLFRNLSKVQAPQPIQVDALRPSWTIEDVIEAVDPRLLEAARALGVSVFGLDRTFAAVMISSAGMYDTHADHIVIAPHRVINHGYDPAFVNFVLAHEIIHATGHSSRLNRSFVGILSVTKGSVHRVPCEMQDTEEVVADLGAMLLMRRFGIQWEGTSERISKWLHHYGRENGVPRDSDAAAAIDAVEYVMMRLERLEEVSDATERNGSAA